MLSEQNRGWQPRLRIFHFGLHEKNIIKVEVHGFRVQGFVSGG